MECDLSGYLRGLVSNRIREALKSDKTSGSLEYLGCTIEDFKRHIEKSFKPGMSWENHGAYTIDGPRVWHIDHITPVKFQIIDGTPPTLEEVKSRLHWTNTQAMWADENISKGNRFDGNPHKMIEEHRPPKLTDEEMTALMADLGL